MTAGASSFPYTAIQSETLRSLILRRPSPSVTTTFRLPTDLFLAFSSKKIFSARGEESIACRTGSATCCQKGSSGV